MEGHVSAGSVTEQSGVIPRSVHTIFDHLSEGKYEDYSVKVSMLELYNEELSDLLVEQEERAAGSTMGTIRKEKDSDSDVRKELRIFEDTTGKKGMIVQGLEEIPVTSSSEVFALLQKANKNRKVAETNLNARSSRSHYVFTIVVHTKEYNEDGEDIIKTGKLYLVDLAGSECIGKSGAVDKRAKEAGRINQSLLTLGRVINALVDRSSFIPYRDSKLTRLLQESLGGRAKTVIIATVSPSYAAFDETLSTLDYAHRAKSIQNKPQQNQKTTKRAYMKELLLEIASLKRENEVLRTKNGIIISPEQYQRWQAESSGKTMQIDELLYKIKQQETKLESLTQTLSDKETLLQTTIDERNTLQTNLTDTTAMLESTRMTLAEMKANLVASQNLLIQLQRTLHAREIELENTRAIVKAHSVTESELKGQATVLVATLEDVIQQTDLLHEKIQRKAAVEAHNLKEASIFSTKTTSDLTQLNSSEAEFDDQIGTHSEQLSGQVDAIGTKVQDRFTSLDAARVELEERAQAKISDMKTAATAFHGERVTKISAGRENGIAYQADLSQRHAAIGQAAREACTRSNSALQALSGSVASGFASCTSAYGVVHGSSQSFTQDVVAPGLTRLQGASVAHVASHDDAARATMAKLAEFAAEQQKKVDADAEALKSKIATMQAAMLASIQTMQLNFMNDVNAMIASHQESQLSHLRASVASLSSSVEVARDQSSNVHSNIQSELAQMVEANKMFQHNTDEWHQKQVDQVEEKKTEVDAQFKQIEAETQSDLNAFQKSINGAEEANQARAAAIDADAKEMVAAVATFNTDLHASLDSLSGSIASQSASIGSSLTLGSSEMSSGRSTLLDLSTSIRTLSSDHTGEFGGRVSSLLASVSGLVTADLKSDLPTGMTPQKASVAYLRPNEFAATASPATIIREYRAEHRTQPIQWQGIIKMDGVDEITADESMDELLIEPTMAMAAPLTIDVNNAAAGTAPTSVASTPIAAATPTAVAQHVRQSSVDKAAVSASPLDVDDSENARPTPTNLASAQPESSSAVEKAALKRPASRIAPASKIAAPIATAANKPLTRSRFGYATETK